MAAESGSETEGEEARSGGVGPNVGRSAGRSLRTRLALLVVAALLAAMVAFSVLVAQMFVGQQRAQLDAALERELTRVQAIVSGSQVGANFVADGTDDLTLQFVSNDGRVRIPVDAETALPAVDAPTLDRGGASPRLIGTTTWRLPSGTEVGTIRIALDVSDAFAARRALVRSMVLAGAVVLTALLLVSLELLRRMLRPLRRLETAARSVDPAAPVPVEHRGPPDEIARVADALNEALEGIREHQRRERDMLTEVSHELGGPLSVVAGQLELLAIELEGDPRAETAQAAHEAATELLHTSRDLITLARGELGIELRLEPVDLADVARHVQREYPAVRLEVEPAPTMGDLRRLRQALRNLVRSGIDVGGADTVRVRVVRRGDAVEATVDDGGPGLAPEELEHVFDRHFRLRRGAVSGIGLAVVKEIVEQHGGSVGAGASESGGNRYTIRLPAASDDAPLDDGNDGRGRGERSADAVGAVSSAVGATPPPD